MNGATSTGAGTGIDALEYNTFSFFINAASVTTGGTVKIQGLTPANDWVDINETTVSADGDTLVETTGVYLQVRGNLTARTDGTYTVTAIAKESKITEEEEADTSESIVSTTGLVSFWKLDEASGSRADSHGSNTLTDNNTVGQGAGEVFANAADFERGNSEYLSITDASQSGLDITGDMTICAWVNAESFPAGQYPTIAIKWKNTTNQRAYALYRSVPDGEWWFDVSGNGATSQRTTVKKSHSASTSTWYFISAYHDSNDDEIGISVNGGSVTTASHTHGIHDSSEPFYIGIGDYSGDLIYPWDGLMGPAMLFNRRLSNAESTALANKNDPFYDQFQ